MRTWVPLVHGYTREHEIIVLNFHVVISVLLGLTTFNFYYGDFEMNAKLELIV